MRADEPEFSVTAIRDAGLRPPLVLATRAARAAALVLVAVFLAALAACHAAHRDDVASGDSGTTLPTRQEVLRIGTSGDYAPFSKDGAGFDIEVARRLAADLGYRIEWVAFKWPELETRVRENVFDVAMSGITWRAERSVVGWMSRAVSVGGPCVLGRAAAQPQTLAVNRGGALERWARRRFDGATIRAVDDNSSLPLLLERGEVDAIVTDSFEVRWFERPGWRKECEPPRDRKVYWVSPARAADLGPRIDAWLARNEQLLRLLRGRFLEQSLALDPVFHAVDLIARRLALMPAVAAYKRAHGLSIDDPKREQLVLETAEREAARNCLEAVGVRTLFEAQIEIAKAVQRRTRNAESLDLDAVLRPALATLGERIVAAVAGAVDELPALELSDLELLAAQLELGERERLLAALRAVRAVEPTPGERTTSHGRSAPRRAQRSVHGAPL